MFNNHDHVKMLNMKIAGTLPKPEKKADTLQGLTGKQRRNAKKKERRKRKKLERS